jgi:hypothetical protein
VFGDRRHADAEDVNGFLHEAITSRVPSDSVTSGRWPVAAKMARPARAGH